MSLFTLYMANQNIAPWSMRPWLVLSYLDIQFEQIVIPLHQLDTPAKIKSISPSALLPVLKHRDLLVWDSLSICEYLAEIFPEKKLWPQNQDRRAYARSISAEIHAGFAALKKHLPMDIKLKKEDFTVPKEALADIKRVLTIWEDCLEKFHGPFLFGDFTITDAMYAPVVTRFKIYNVKLPLFAENYVNYIYDFPMMQQWRASIPD